MTNSMKRQLTILALTLLTLTAGAQSTPALEQLKANPRKAYGTDYPYQQEACPLTKTPKGYKPFYISHYGEYFLHNGGCLVNQENLGESVVGGLDGGAPLNDLTDLKLHLGIV